MRSAPGRHLGRALLMVWAIASALLVGRPARSEIHFLFGLEPGPYTVTADGQMVAAGLEVAAGGVLSFQTDRRGTFTVGRDTVIVAPCPDLLVVQSGNQTVLCGGTMRIHVKVRNQGQVSAPVSLTSILLDGALAGQVSTPAIPPGADVWSDWLTISKAPGRYVLGGCADSGGTIAESDESNNCVQ